MTRPPSPSPPPPPDQRQHILDPSLKIYIPEPAAPEPAAPRTRTGSTGRRAYRTRRGPVPPERCGSSGRLRFLWNAAVPQEGRGSPGRLLSAALGSPREQRASAGSILFICFRLFPPRTGEWRAINIALARGVNTTCCSLANRWRAAGLAAAAQLAANELAASLAPRRQGARGQLAHQASLNYLNQSVRTSHKVRYFKPLF